MAERPAYPTAADNRAAWRELHDLELECSFVGRVQNWNAATQTCEIIPLIKSQIPQPDGTYLFEELPVIPSVAVLQMRSRGAFLSLPVQDGDTLLCLALDSDHTAWRRGDSDEVVAPRDLRRHHIAHAVALCGFYRYNQGLRRASVEAANATVSATDTPGIVLGYDAADGTRLLMKPDGSVDITRGSTVVVRVDTAGMVHLGGAAGQFVALAPATDAIVSSLKSLIAGWTPVPNDGGASLKALIASWSPASTAATKVKGV